MNNAIATTTGRQVLPMLSTTEELVAVRTDRERYPWFCDLPYETRLKNIKIILVACYKLKHFKDLDYIDSDASVLERKISAHRNFRAMTCREIYTALANGATGDYGECRSLTVEFCMNSLLQYARRNAETYRALNEAPAKPMDPQLQGLFESGAKMFLQANAERMKTI